MGHWNRRATLIGGLIAAWVLCAAGAAAQQQTNQALLGAAWNLERSGQAADSARRVRDAAAAAPADPSTLRTLAEYLENHGSPQARQAYVRLADLLERTGAPAADRAAVARRLAVLDLLANDREAAARHLAAFAAAGGTGLALGTAPAASATEYIEIPEIGRAHV